MTPELGELVGDQETDRTGSYDQDVRLVGETIECLLALRDWVVVEGGHSRLAGVMQEEGSPGDGCDQTRVLIWCPTVSVGRGLLDFVDADLARTPLVLEDATEIYRFLPKIPKKFTGCYQEIEIRPYAEVSARTPFPTGIVLRDLPWVTRKSGCCAAEGMSGTSDPLIR